MAIKRPIPRAEGVNKNVNDEVLFSSYSIIMKSGKTLQEEWDEHLRELEELKGNLGTVKEFVGDHINVPYQLNKLYYSPGTYQEPTWKGYNSQFMTKSGQETGINAGEYKVTFKFTEPDKYTWSDGTNNDQTVSWYIDRQMFSVDPVQKEPYPEYDGNLKSPVWKNQTDLELEVVGNTGEQSEAGIHDIYLKPKDNYAWHDGSYEEKKFTWQILRKKISLPVQVSVLYYDGKTKRPTWDDNGKTTLVEVVDGYSEGVDAKTYDIWFKPTKNAMWQDGTTDMRKTTWTISAAALASDVTGPDGKISDIVLTFDGSELKPDFQNYDPAYISAVDISVDANGNIVESATITHRNVGSYTTKFTPNGNSSWTNGSKTPIIITWEIQKMSVAVPYIKYNNKTSDITIPYEGKDIGPDLIGYDSKWMIVEFSTGIKVKEYTTKFTLKEANNTYWEGGGTIAKTYVWSIVPRLVKVPKLIESVVPYNNGAEVSPTIEQYDTNIIKVSDNKATNVGSDYKVKFELIDPESSAWDDETHSTGPKYASWSIAPITVTAPTITGNTFTYRGEEQGPTISTYDTQQISVTDALKINAGTYTLKLQLRKRGVVWSDTGDSQDKTFTWQILTKKIAVPEVSDATNKTYIGKKQYVIVSGNDGERDFIINGGATSTGSYESKYLTITGAEGEFATDYEVKMDLKDKNNTEWTIGGTDTQTFSWKILKKYFNVPTVTGIYPFDGSEQTCQFNGFYDKYMTVSGDKATNVGSHTATFALTDKINLSWIDNSTDPKDVIWFITAIGIEPTSLSIHNADVTYDGKEHQVTASNITGFSEELFRLDGDLKKTSAGKYTVKVYLKDTTVNQWTDSKPATEPVELKWNINTRSMSVPTMQNPGTLFEYDSKTKTVTLDHCTFGSADDKDFITLKDNTGVDAGTYTSYFSIKTDHKGSCVWSLQSSTTTDDQPFTWKINKTYISTWSIKDSKVDITGATGSYVDLDVTRPGNGLINVDSYDGTLISAEVIDGTGVTPKVRFKDTGNVGIGITEAVISVKEGSNYHSSNESSKQNTSCKASWSCQVKVITKVDPNTLTPERIADIVKKGLGPSVWDVGTIIPVELGQFALSGKRPDYISAGKYGAVVLGYDHNITVENPTAEHTMTLAIMKWYENVGGMTLSWLQPGKTTIAFIDRNGNALALRRGDYDNNVFKALSQGWQNVIIDTKKSSVSGSVSKKVFQLAITEVFQASSISSHDDKNTEQYEYFKKHPFSSEMPIPICSLSTADYIHVGSTSDKSSDLSYWLLTKKNNYNVYDINAKKFKQYTKETLEFLGISDVMVGMIPCFNIGG